MILLSDSLSIKIYEKLMACEKNHLPSAFFLCELISIPTNQKNIQGKSWQKNICSI